MRTTSFLCLLAGLLMAAPEPATAFDVKVVVTIDEVEVFDEIDEPSGDADFYAVVTIDGVVKQTDPCALEDAGDLISPGWEFSENVDINAKNQVAVEIEIWDDDGVCPGAIDIGTDDEQMDIDPDAGRTLNFTVDLSPCAVSGEAAGACNVVLTAAGDAGDDVGQIKFRVKVEEPPSAAGFRILCTHTPLLPAGGNVTINATALDGALAQKVADTLEIYVTELTSLATPPPPSGTPALSASSNSLLTHTDGPFAVGFAYGCRAVDDGVPIWSGWKSVAPLPPMAGEIIQAVGVTGPTASRLDIVFIGDADNFNGPTSAALQTAVANSISGGYWGLDVYLANQDKINFWLAGTLGDAEAVIPGQSCPHVPPLLWNILYVFADAGAILHTDNFRDCATPNQAIFSTEPTSFGTLQHETGHQPFGLADEYCDQRAGSASSTCDGGYFQTSPFPNVYETLAICQADLANVGNSACQTFASDNDGATWSVSDPVSNDLMVDNLTPQNGDTRRINWLFDQCSQGRC